MTWVYAIPAWLFFIAVVAVMCAISAGGLLLFRRFASQGEELTHNDVAGPIIATIGTILAVVLSFLLVTVWQQYDGAAATVQQEASAVADLYQLSAELPQPTQSKLRAALREYVDAVVNQEWPAMRSGGRSSAARQAALSALAIVARYQPRGAAQQAMQQEALGFAHTAEDARRDRLFVNDQGIPMFFWVGNVLLAAITIAFCYLFRVRSESVHLVMTLALTAVIGTIFVLIALFDYPFRGSTQISPSLFMRMQQTAPNALTESD